MFKKKKKAKAEHLYVLGGFISYLKRKRKIKEGRREKRKKEGRKRFSSKAWRYTSVPKARRIITSLRHPEQHN